MAGVLNVMAGGGSLFTLPVLLFLGFPAALANGTNRVAILVQNIVATQRFSKHRLISFRDGIKLAAVALPGAVVGAYLSLDLSEVWFRRILALIIVVGGVGLLVKRANVRPASEPLRLRWWTYAAFVGIGFYGGFIQAGVGMLFMVVLYNLVGLDLLRVNANKVFIVSLYTLPALAVFIRSGNVAWKTGLILAVGNSVGALIGTSISMGKGEGAIRMVVGVALFLMAIRLLFQW